MLSLPVLLQRYRVQHAVAVSAMRPDQAAIYRDTAGPGPARHTLLMLAVVLGAALLAGIGRVVRGGGRTHLSCHERGRLLLVPVAEVLYFKADTKYVTARTVDREYLLDEALTHLEGEFAERFMRLHRAVLVAKAALAGFEKAAGDDVEAYGWALLRGVPDKLPVSRRQWAPAKAALTG